MKAKGGNNISLESYEKKLQNERRDSKKGLSIAEDILKLNLINNLIIDGRGNPPSPLRHVGRGTRGELWFRNKLLRLRTIPLEDDISFMITHSEAPAYYKGKRGANRADLLGIWHSSGGNTKLGVIELKAGVRGDHVLYAIMEGLRNLYLHRNAIKRLHSGWSMALNQCHEGGWSNAWSRSNPFNKRLGNSHLIIIGDGSWIGMQENWKNEAKEITEKIKIIFNYETSIYSLNDCEHYSKPYVLLPLTRWL